MVIKKHILIGCIFLFFFSFCATAQTSEEDLISHWKKDQQVRQTGMLILGGWAVGNIGLGLIQRARLEKGRQYYFHEMNMLWNTVNLAIAGAGYYFSSTQATPESYFALHDDAVQFQKILLFNAGLDIGYMVAGAYLLEKSKNSERRSRQFKGYGQSLLLQGGFLFVFDLVMHTVHAKLSPELSEVLSNISISPMHLSYNFKF